MSRFHDRVTNVQYSRHTRLYVFNHFILKCYTTSTQYVEALPPSWFTISHTSSQFSTPSDAEQGDEYASADQAWPWRFHRIVLWSVLGLKLRCSQCLNGEWSTRWWACFNRLASNQVTPGTSNYRLK